MAYIYDLADTWNASGTTFTAIKMNVTDTASASGSLLMDLQVGGVSRFSVTKAGQLNVPAQIVFSSGDGRISRQAGFGGIVFSSSNDITLGAGAGVVYINVSDLAITRDAADTLAQRRSTNAQAFRLYNTFTDASNYERGKMEWASNVLRIGTEKAGTGTARALEFQTDGTTRLTIGATGVATFTAGISSAAYVVATASAYIGVSTRFYFESTSTGVVALRDWEGTGFGRLQFGGTTSSFPAIKRSTTALQARLADDSAFTNIQGKITTETAYTAGAPTATGYLVLYDSNGTAYKVPAEAL